MGGKNSYESIKRYQDKAYDKILIRTPKGKKDVIQVHAEAQGESVNGFINRAIDEAIERDTSLEAHRNACKGRKLSGEYEQRQEVTNG